MICAKHRYRMAETGQSQRIWRRSAMLGERREPSAVEPGRTASARSGAPLIDTEICQEAPEWMRYAPFRHWKSSTMV